MHAFQNSTNDPKLENSIQAIKMAKPPLSDEKDITI
jgi:hypothetical protein